MRTSRSQCAAENTPVLDESQAVSAGASGQAGDDGDGSDARSPQDSVVQKEVRALIAQVIHARVQSVEERNGRIAAALEEAEEIRDPVEELLEAVHEEPSVAFADESVELLLDLRRKHPRRFEETRSLLKKSGVRVGELDRTLDRYDEDRGEGVGGGSRRSQADVLVEIALESATVFHDPDHVGYADVEIEEHREAWAIRATGFRRWLIRSFLNVENKAPNADALQCALNTLEAIASRDGEERIVSVRVAEHDGRLYLDLADERWRAIEITTHGWSVTEEPPVRFIRTRGTRSLPEPVRGSSIDELRQFVNVKHDEDFILVVAWLLGTLRGRGPYPALVLNGEQGSAKSTLARLLRSVVDPREPELRALPREERDLFIAVKSSHVIAFDNISRIPDWLSDAFCRVASGSGFATRTLYSNDEETFFSGARPLLLNGIEELIARPDLADRSVMLTLDPIPHEARRMESELQANFNQMRPRILGALLDAASCGLRELPGAQLDRLPRMADFAVWAVACEPALPWSQGSFLVAYDGNRRGAIEGVLESDPAATIVLALMAGREEWRGVAKDLLRELGSLAGEDQTRKRDWPTSPKALANRMRRAAPFLRELGIEVSFSRTGRAREITISRVEEHVGNRSSQPSPPSRGPEGEAFQSDDEPDEPSPAPSPRDPRSLGEDDGGDDRDDLSTPASAGERDAGLDVELLERLDGDDQGGDA